jgi:hypothetical protein
MQPSIVQVTPGVAAGLRHHDNSDLTRRSLFANAGRTSKLAAAVTSISAVRSPPHRPDDDHASAHGKHAEFAEEIFRAEVIQDHVDAAISRSRRRR